MAYQCITICIITFIKLVSCTCISQTERNFIMQVVCEATQSTDHQVSTVMLLTCMLSNIVKQRIGWRRFLSLDHLPRY